MAILDVRIDDRLIHGQVCGFWIPHYSLERIAKREGTTVEVLKKANNLSGDNPVIQPGQKLKMPKIAKGAKGEPASAKKSKKGKKGADATPSKKSKKGKKKR